MSGLWLSLVINPDVSKLQRQPPHSSAADQFAERMLPMVVVQGVEDADGDLCLSIMPVGRALLPETIGSAEIQQVVARDSRIRGRIPACESCSSKKEGFDRIDG